jgi:hypothetical protein
MKSYDIFRRDASGPIWVDARLYVENARARIQELGAHVLFRFRRSKFFRDF